ncbi:MAG TPA: hypothetical protein VEK38_03240, partial [Candidatus Bathyarchaeia archaeon]|nr:hypothetical protein [Candidatus Bathyarchaeia archaeon]
MWVVKYSLLTLSAVLYALAFIEPCYCWWMVFIFALPIFYAAHHYRLSFAEGYFWGILVFGLHLHGVLIGIVRMAEGPWHIRLIPVFFIVLYQAFFAALTFWIAHMLAQSNIIKKLLQKNHDTFYTKHAIWTLALLAFSFHLDQLCLLIFDYCEGYVFMNSLIPLAQYPPLLNAFLAAHKMPVKPLENLASFIITPLLIGSFLYIMLQKRAKKTLCAAAIGCVAFCLFFTVQEKSMTKPAYLEHVKPLQLIFWSSPNIAAMANAGRARFIELLKKWPDTEVIILPEAAFYCSHLEKEHISLYWSTEYLGKAIHIILGTFRWSHDQYRNAFLWFYDGIIQASFDKKHAMLLTERTPTLFNRASIHDLYFQRFPEIVPSDNKRPRLQITPNFAIVPYICSELFFNQHADDTFPDTPILAICNDHWAPDYVGNLM